MLERVQQIACHSSANYVQTKLNFVLPESTMPPDPMNDLYSLTVNIFKKSILLILKYKVLTCFVVQNLILHTR